MPIQARRITTLTRQDGLAVAGFVLLAMALYAPLALRLARGVYLDYYNLAFDFDPIRTVDALASTPPDFLGVKHPLFVLLRPLAWPLLAAGLSAKQAVSLLMALFGATRVALCFVFLRQAAIERPIAAALTLLFILSGAQLFTAIIAETYGVAALSIILTWLIAQIRLTDPDRLRRARIAVAVLTFGTTVTNIVQSFIAEMLVEWRRNGIEEAIRRCVRFGLIVSVPVIVLLIAVWSRTLWAELRDPVLAVKQVYWLRTKGPRTGVAEVLRTFFAYGFVSPHYSWLMLPEGINMRDFRADDFPSVGRIAAPLWLVFCAVGSVAAFFHARYRLIAVGLALALVANLLFHLDFQFRGSLYIYAAHVHFLIFALGCGLAPFLTTANWLGRTYLAVVLVLACLMGADNVPIAGVFVTDFDHVRPACTAPCMDAVGQ